MRDTKEEAAADERQYQEAGAESAENMETPHEELHRPKAGRVSADAVASVSQELREAELGQCQFEKFDTVMQSHMQTLLLPQGSARVCRRDQVCQSV